LYAYGSMKGTKYWHSAYNMPEHGIDLTFINTGNPKQLGQQYSTGYLLNLPLNRYKKNNLAKKHVYKNWLGLGIGCGYATRIWDLRDNHQAAVLGSHVNIALTLQYSARIAQLGRSELRAGFRITHFSNGAYQIPNLGTNNAGVFLSYGLRRAVNVPVADRNNVPDIERYRTTVALTVGLKEIPPPLRKKYPAYTFSLLREKRFSYKSSVGLGIDVFYNSSLRTLMERKADHIIPRSDVFQSGLVLSYTLHFDRFELKMQQGFYLYDHYGLDGKFYNRFGLRFRITEYLFAQMTLKTHFAKADFGEWGFGWAFARGKGKKSE